MSLNTGHQAQQNGHGGGGHVIEHAKGAVHEVQELGRSLSETARNVSESVDLRGRVQRNPLLMVAAAAGVGYLLGGGLFTPLTGRILRVGMRLAIVPFVRAQFAAMQGNAQTDVPPAQAPGMETPDR